MPLRLERCLHLKTGVSSLGSDPGGAPTIVINRDWLDPALFPGMERIEVDDAEPFSANCLRAGAKVIQPAGNPRTAERLRGRGFDVVEVDVSELQKAVAGVTCMSLIEED